jgi:hypothetical protein
MDGRMFRELTMNNLKKIDIDLSMQLGTTSDAVNLVSQRLPELMAKTESFNRSNSQTTLNMMTLTMMNGQSPLRQIRQILAEIEQRQIALSESQIGYAELREELSCKQESELTGVELAKYRHAQYRLTFMENKIGGAIKDIATLIKTYDNLVELHGLANWTEEDFERSESKHHIRRGFELLYRNIIEHNRPSEATIEYLQQFGVHVQVATREVVGYITYVEELINAKENITASHIEDFLDHMADKYEHCATEAAKRMFGVEHVFNVEFMAS